MSNSSEEQRAFIVRFFMEFEESLDSTINYDYLINGWRPPLSEGESGMHSAPPVASKIRLFS
jgi:hypothetical protein